VDDSISPAREAPGDAAELGALTRAIARVTGWLAGAFYELERTGERVPEGPTLIVANHPNALMDPLIVMGLRSVRSVPSPRLHSSHTR
jgi:1-acyl-sn-glycerol-3-phosphate acyltransferase